jgi:hypothetical protein
LSPKAGILPASGANADRLGVGTAEFLPLAIFRLSLHPAATVQCSWLPRQVIADEIREFP